LRPLVQFTVTFRCSRMCWDCRERDLTFRVEFEIITSVKNEYSVLDFVTVLEEPFVSIFRAEEWENIRLVLPRRCRQTFSRKCCYCFTKLHGLMSQNNVAFIGCTLCSYKGDVMGGTCNTSGNVNTFVQIVVRNSERRGISHCVYTYS
jgi:hypothetical protein